MLTGEATPTSLASTSMVVLFLILSPVSSEPCGPLSPEVKSWIQTAESTYTPARPCEPSPCDRYSGWSWGRSEVYAPISVFDLGLVRSGNDIWRFRLDYMTPFRIVSHPQAHRRNTEYDTQVRLNAQACLRLSNGLWGLRHRGCRPSGSERQ